MHKGIDVEIIDDGCSYEYSKMNWMKYKDGVLTINYQDYNDEECEEFGDAPDMIIFHPYTVKEEDDDNTTTNS